VLSWAQRYDDSIRGYRELLARTPSSVAPDVLRDTRIGYARVLMWSRRFEESLAAIERALDGAGPEEKRELTLMKARQLAYLRRYPESLQTFDQALAAAPTDAEAQLGKAQALYWSGRLRDAARSLRSLLEQNRHDAGAAFTLAAVENQMGRYTRALDLLRSAEDNADTRQLRAVIQDQMRPSLRIRHVFGDDEEIPTSGLSTSNKNLRYQATLEFSLTPDVRMEIDNVVGHTLSSNALLSRFSGDALSSETLARVRVRPAHWLLLRAGAGVGTTGAGTVCAGVSCLSAGRFDRAVRPLYDVRPTLLLSRWRLELFGARRLADYTPLATHQRALLRREGFALTFDHPGWRRFGAEWARTEYSVEREAVPQSRFTPHSHVGALFWSPVVYSNERVRFEAGVRGDVMGFDSTTERMLVAIDSAGFFSPRLFQRVSGTSSLDWRVTPGFAWNLHGTFGPQKVFGFRLLEPPQPEWGTTGSAGTQFTLRRGGWEGFIAYDFFGTATAASPGLRNGSYRSQVFTLGFYFRF
jgi:tetratricopeptide (TPR) repeat protein